MKEQLSRRKRISDESSEDAIENEEDSRGAGRSIPACETIVDKKSQTLQNRAQRVREVFLSFP